MAHVLSARRRRSVDGAPNGLTQPGKPVLQQIIAGAAVHGFHGQIFAHAPRYEDERNVERALPQQVQCLKAVEQGHVGIGQDYFRLPIQLR